MKKQAFIAIAGILLIALPIMSKAIGNSQPSQKAKDVTFPELPYAYNALEPAIDAKTMEIHYSRHHQAYFNNFIAALKDSPAGEMDLMELFANISKQSAAIRNNGGGYYNHKLFWENMGSAKTEPSAKLKAAIEKDFGSFDKFKADFSDAAKKQFGSGWAWLCVDKSGKLFVSSTPNQDNPLMDVVDKRGTPLLCLDVWEHAYYLQYQNKRADYVDNFWKVVNWDTVNKRFESK